jgi:hypothetical protein
MAKVPKPHGDPRHAQALHWQQTHANVVAFPTGHCHNTDITLLFGKYDV